MPSDVPEHVVQGTNVYIKCTPGRGNGTFSSQNIKAKSQLMYVTKPLMAALEIAKLPTNCYFCFRSSGEAGMLSASPNHGQKLKTCSGCKVVKFCDQVGRATSSQRTHANPTEEMSETSLV